MIKKLIQKLLYLFKKDTKIKRIQSDEFFEFMEWYKATYGIPSLYEKIYKAKENTRSV